MNNASVLAETGQATPSFDAAEPGRRAHEWVAFKQGAPEVATEALSRFQRLVVVAAHPDDETLMAAGLMARMHHLGCRVEVVLLSAGGASHPHSPTHTPAQLCQVRAQESQAALVHSAPGAELTVLDGQDGHVGETTHSALARVVDLLGDARDTLVISPLLDDGHPDHTAAATVASAAAYRTGATWWASPIWWWHWAQPQTPAGAPPSLAGAVRLELTSRERQRKAAAIAEHTSQVVGLSPAEGDQALLAPTFLEHFASEEVFAPGECVDVAFEQLHRESDDPWHTRTSEYEQRKQALVLAMLPQRRFTLIADVGCSVGTLTSALATRAERVLALDASPTALGLAASVVPANVELRLCDLRTETPDLSGCDLIVVSEMAYFLAPLVLEALVEVCVRAASRGAHVVWCHYRGPIVGFPLDGDSAHESLRASLRRAFAEVGPKASAPRVLASYREEAFEALLVGPSLRQPR